METKPTRRRRRRGQARKYTLTQRDLTLLSSILEFGGVLTTIQLSTLLWPPDVGRRLAGLGVSGAQIAAWIDAYPPAYLTDKREQMKWGLRVNRVRDKMNRNKADIKLVEWISGLEPLLQEELRIWLDELAAVDTAAWLTTAVTEDRQPPHAFTLRYRQPSDDVSSACKTRLRYLAGQGLIELQEQATRLAAGRAQACWFLTREGRNVLARTRGIKANTLDWKRPGAYGTLHLAHRLAVNDFRIAVELACRHKGYVIRRWLDDNQLKRMLEQEKVTLMRMVRDAASGSMQQVAEEQRLRIPDGFFWLDMGDGRERHCFFELDNATLTLRYTNANPKDFAQKIRTLSAFYRSGRYKELFPEAGDSMWLLTVTTGSEKRCRHLKETAEQVIGAHSRAQDRYWFACITDIPTWEDPFTEAVFQPIWWRAGEEKRWRLDEEK